MKKTIKYQLRTLSKEQYSEAPEAVRKVYLHVQKNVPLSDGEKRRILSSYPEYFTKSIERTFGQNIKRMYRKKKGKKINLATNEQTNN